MPSTKASLRFLIAFLWLGVAPAIAEDTARLTLKLSIDEVAEITRLIDLQDGATFTQNMPQAYWDLQTDINRTLRNNPDALRALLSARSNAR